MRANELINARPEAFREKLLEIFAEQVAKDFDVVFGFTVIFGTVEYNEVRKKENWFEIMETALKECEEKEDV